MSAWRHNTADRAMITEQFSYLVDETKGFTALAKFRKAAGERTFPSIAKFKEDFEMSRRDQRQGKPKLGEAREMSRAALGADREP